METVYEEAEVSVEVESCHTIMEEPSPRRKKKSKGQGDGVDRPKKPRSAYLLYYFDVHQSLQQENPELPQSEINKRISDSWKRLNVSDKGYYLEKARLEKDGISPKTLSGTASQNIPGFRKILPRANYVLLPRVSGVEEGPSGGKAGSAERAGETFGDVGDGMFSPMGFGSEVELADQGISNEGLGEGDTARLDRSETLQASASHTFITAKSSHQTAEQESCHVGDVGAAMEDGLQGVALMQQVKSDSAHLVTIIPSQGTVERKVAPTTRSVVMIPIASSLEPHVKPSVKLSIKYTRRGRGSCNTPGCSFAYVTRHKPPHCPMCGLHLGGKWVAQTKKNPAVPGNRASQRKQKKEEGEQRKDQQGDEKSSPQATKPILEIASSLPAGGASSSSGEAMVAVQKCSVSLKPMSCRLRGKTKSASTGNKRPVRAILPAPASTVSPAALVQWIAVPPDKAKAESRDTSFRAVQPSSGSITVLKPSTLKQLGHAASPNPLEQSVPPHLSSGQYVVTENGIRVLSMLPVRHNSGSNLDLGLSTARGRGRCKNPLCNYVYKNRHKPQHCPNCGWELSRAASRKSKIPASVEGVASLENVLDPYTPLTAAQKDIQRQNTLLLLRRSLQIPESEAELQDALALIQQLNSTQVVVTSSGDETSAQLQTGWPCFYEPPAELCSLCQYPLFKGGHGSAAGQEDCWLLTESHLQTATIQLKICINPQCLALHSLVDLYPGLFNVGNKLLVSVDLFFKIRNHIRLGHDPTLAALSVLQNVQNQQECNVDMQELQELLCSGYWAFESLTVRDYNDMICGVCGIAPKVEIAQRNTNNALLLHNVKFTWPDFAASDEVHVDEFWLTMENEALEQAAFPSSPPITRFDASIIAPFIPPLMRNSTVINTERDKIQSDECTGDLSMLVRLIHEGRLSPENLFDDQTHDELMSVLQSCGVPVSPDSSKNELIHRVCSLYTHIQNGQATGSQPPHHMTAGKLSKLCPHQVVCGSKYMVRNETARDHVDLLLSSRFWPPVYITDAAQQVALCTDVLYPELGLQMWGRNQGCFSDPMGKAEYVSCEELQDQLYSVDLMAVETPQVHPVTKSPSRWIVSPAGSLSADRHPHHNMALCRELEAYTGLVEELHSNSDLEADGLTEEAPPSVNAVRRRALTFDSAAYYYLYNRLLDFLLSREVVSAQIAQVLSACQPGEVVIRDALYRLGVAQINTENEEDEEEVEETGVELKSDLKEELVLD